MKPARPAASSQLGFGFDEPAPAPPGPAKPQPAQMTQPAPATPPVASAPPVAPESSAEAIARTLEAHPDYRVLRRLVPGRVFNTPAPGQKLSKGIVLDTETTGFDVAQDRVIELGMLAFEFDPVTGVVYRVVDVLDELEDPGFAIPPATIAVHHITDEMVKGHRIDDARVAEFLKNVDVVIAHNAAFDRPFVEARLPQFSTVRWACSFADIDWKAQGRGSAKLESLAQAQGWFYDAHRAEMDCHALLAVLCAPLPQAPNSAAEWTALATRMAANPWAQSWPLWLAWAWWRKSSGRPKRKRPLRPMNTATSRRCSRLTARPARCMRSSMLAW